MIDTEVDCTADSDEENKDMIARILALEDELAARGRAALDHED